MSSLYQLSGSQPLSIREGIERITIWFCHRAVPQCNESRSACACGFSVSIALFVGIFCLFLISIQSSSCEREPAAFTHLSHKHVNLTCLLSAPTSTCVQPESTDQIKTVQIREKFCLASKTRNWWDFTLTLSRQNQSVLVPTDQYQKTALGVMTVLPKHICTPRPHLCLPQCLAQGSGQMDAIGPCPLSHFTG